ncbi:MAG TPA: 3-phosphoshikimate 1-carboxyvinyltransferase, partial [Pyrinomonadaceae bacterium]|nr:3-phosphoshikimate 1-carboxyvinyltransferase [Pyrinomonadaceae bacterium]
MARYSIIVSFAASPENRASGKIAKMKVRPAQRIIGDITLSGDKSISHRAAIVASLARGPSIITNFSHSQDCASTLNCLRDIGVSVAAEGNTWRVLGQGLGDFTRPAKSLDCGNSGSTMRMLAGLLAGQDFTSELTGDQSLSSRPMRRIIEPLEMMGAQIESQDGKPPLRISGSRPLRSIHYELPVASAQVKSCVLLAGLHADGRTAVIERVRTRDHTERMLSWYEAPIEVRDKANCDAEISIVGGTPFFGREVGIPGDLSSAAVIVAAAALLPGSNLTINALSLNRTRTQFLSELNSLGAEITFEEVRDIYNEPVGNV